MAYILDKWRIDRAKPWTAPSEFQLKRLNWRATLYRVVVTVTGDVRQTYVYAVDAATAKAAKTVALSDRRAKFIGDWKFAARAARWPIVNGVPKGLNVRPRRHAGEARRGRRGPKRNARGRFTRRAR